MKKIILILLAFFTSTITFSQEKVNYQSVIDTLLNKTEDNYIFPDVAEHVKQQLLGLKKNTFSELSKKQFADTITFFLEKYSKDKHFVLLYRPNFLKKTESKKVQQQKFNEINKRWNFGFESVQRLPGNIGYIHYSGFAEPTSSKATLAAAMNFVANTNSLIIDLRDNRGGDIGMVELFSSYFFSNKETLSKTYYRFENKTVVNKTKVKVSGKKYLGKPIYILTNKNSFSGAEALSYHLKNRGIATIIGEKTAGASNPVEMFVINNEFLLFVPVGNMHDPITGKNWEHIGVEPTYYISSDKALEKAQIVALNHILKQKLNTELLSEEIEKRITDLTKKIQQ
ncbi:S41 family peptidase [Tenacibaculum sp. TC6]|uniref:S41 family peptidase n=1 Tax=Tenacibaculum sp. TC6 TaxID=3423223 RepID=UPI003D36E80C